MTVPRVSPQAGKGGAELPQLGALARHLQDAIGQDGAPVKYVAGVKASGTITMTGTGTANDTVTVGGTTLTLVAATPAAGEVLIGGSATATRDNLLAALQVVAADEGVTVAASSTDAITVTAIEEGAAGNAIVLAKSSTNVTVTGAGTLTSGVTKVPGTAASAGSIRVDGTDIYIAIADTTETDTSGWKHIAVGAGL